MPNSNQRSTDRSSNDQRADVKNPNNGSFKDDANNHSNVHNPNNQSYQSQLDNHANQLNPNNPQYRGNSGK